MKLSELRIHNLRNIKEAQITVHPQINIITGPNGSGKTTFLEAIYLLGSGRSFRSKESASLITHGQEQLTIFAKSFDNQSISLQKSQRNPTIARLNNTPCLSGSELAAFLPCQLFFQDLFQIIDAGSGYRRALLDWGLFHVEHTYFSIWKEYKRTLKQRNSLLKQRAKPTHLLPWNQILSSLADQLHHFRLDYFKKFQATFFQVLQDLAPNIFCQLEYEKGWDKKKEDKSLQDILCLHYEHDIQRQYTHYGPHQADLVLQSQDAKAKHYFSRGQQKVILFALKLAQAQLLNKPCIFLIDDLASELDSRNIENVFAYLLKMQGQIFISAQTSNVLNLTSSGIDVSFFNMENGVVNAHSIE